MAGRLLAAALVALAAAAILLLLRTDPTTSTLEVVTASTALDAHLARHAAELGGDLPAYKGHCLRVLSYANHLLRKEGVDPKPYQRDLAAALAYHDLGIWTDATFNYLPPSSARASRELKGQVAPSRLPFVEAVIDNHHKATPYKGDGVDAKVVDAVRRGDWADASMGLVRLGLSRGDVARATAALPYAGFHAALLRAGPRLYGANLLRAVWDFAHIFKV